MFKNLSKKQKIIAGIIVVTLIGVAIWYFFLRNKKGASISTQRQMPITEDAEAEDVTQQYAPQEGNDKEPQMNVVQDEAPKQGSRVVNN